MRRIISIFIAAFLLATCTMYGQEIAIDAISSGGGYTESAASGSHCWTVGQFVFVTHSDANGSLTQGFQQPQCAPAGTPCDDGNACSINDVEDGACNCSGVPGTNTLPTAIAGGVYQLASGNDLTLDGTGSIDADLSCGDALTYEWDLNDDGVFGDVTGAIVLVPWATLNAYGINANGAYNISLKVTDKAGETNSQKDVLFVSDTGTVPTLSQWGLIIFGLLALSLASIAMWQRRYNVVVVKQSV